MSGRLVGLFLLLVMVLALGGCVSHKAPASGDVVLMLRATPEQLRDWQEVVKAFTEASKIGVTIQNESADSYYNRLQAMVSGGKPPDVVFMDSTRFPEFVSKGALENLDPYLKQQTELKAEDFYPVAWQSYQFQGSAYGVPNDLSVLGMAFDVNQFELAGLKPPPATWTWDDYLKMAQALTLDQNGDGRIDTWGTTVCPWWQVYVWQNGGELVDDVQNPRHSTLNTPEAQGGLQFLADLIAKHKVAPSPSLTRGDSRVKSFAAGQVSLIYLERADSPAAGKSDSRWEATWIPQGKVAANLGSGSGYCLAKGAPHAQDAWKLITFLAGNDGQKLLLAGGFQTPARPVLVKSEYFAGEISQGGAAPFAAGIKVMRPMPFTTRYAEIAAIWSQELDRLWSGQATVAEVTQAIDQKVDQVLAQAQPATAWLLPVMRPL